MHQYARQSWSSRCGERHVAILGRPCPGDVDGHAVGVEVGDLEGDDLADAEATGVGGREQQAMPGVGAGAQQAPDLLAAEDVGQLLRLLGRGDVERRLLAPERHVVEKPERVRGLGARAPRPLPRPGRGARGTSAPRRRRAGRAPAGSSRARPTTCRMYASWVRGENPRTVMSRIMRVRSSLMSHLREESWDGGDCEPARKRCRERSQWETTPRSSERACSRATRVRPYRVSGLVQLEFGPWIG